MGPEEAEAALQAEIDRQWEAVQADIKEMYGPGKLELLKGERSIRAMFVMGFCRGFWAGKGNKNPIKGAQ